MKEKTSDYIIKGKCQVFSHERTRLSSCFIWCQFSKSVYKKFIAYSRHSLKPDLPGLAFWPTSDAQKKMTSNLSIFDSLSVKKKNKKTKPYFLGHLKVLCRWLNVKPWSITYYQLSVHHDSQWGRKVVFWCERLLWGRKQNKLCCSHCFQFTCTSLNLREVIWVEMDVAWDSPHPGFILSVRCVQIWKFSVKPKAKLPHFRLLISEPISIFNLWGNPADCLYCFFGKFHNNFFFLPANIFHLVSRPVMYFFFGSHVDYIAVL